MTREEFNKLFEQALKKWQNSVGTAGLGDCVWAAFHGPLTHVCAEADRSRFGTMVCYEPCKLHEGMPYKMTVGYQPPMKKVCPICEPPERATSAREGSDG